jgi:hypothetical protein
MDKNVNGLGAYVGCASVSKYHFSESVSKISTVKRSGTPPEEGFHAIEREPVASEYEIVQLWGTATLSNTFGWIAPCAVRHMHA